MEAVGFNQIMLSILFLDVSFYLLLQFCCVTNYPQNDKHFWAHFEPTIQAGFYQKFVLVSVKFPHVLWCGLTADLGWPQLVWCESLVSSKFTSFNWAFSLTGIFSQHGRNTKRLREIYFFLATLCDTVSNMSFVKASKLTEP